MEKEFIMAPYVRELITVAELKVRQFKWSKWVNELQENGFATEGRLFLFLHAGKPNGPHFTNNKALVERNFEQVTIIYAKDKSLSLKETTLLYIDEMLKFFPENSSRVDLYLAKAKILCQESKNEAQKNLALANNLLGDGSIQFRCD